MEYSVRMKYLLLLPKLPRHSGHKSYIHFFGINSNRNPPRSARFAKFDADQKPPAPDHLNSGSIQEFKDHNTGNPCFDYDVFTLECGH